MPHSAADPLGGAAPDRNTHDDQPDQRLAVAAEALYIANLLVAPGLAFLLLAWLRWRYNDKASRLVRNHFAQTFFVSLWGGALLVTASLGIVALGGLHSKWTWVAVILYFTCIHSTLILLGVVGLARAMAGREFIYPLIGVHYE